MEEKKIKYEEYENMDLLEKYRNRHNVKKKDTEIVFTKFNIFCVVFVFIIISLAGRSYGGGIVGLFVVNFIVCFSYFFLALIFKSMRNYKILFSILILVHILLFLNVSGWNEGSMEGSKYAIESLKDVSDILCGLFLVSAFTLFMPLVAYIGFLNFLSKAVIYSLKNELN